MKLINWIAFVTSVVITFTIFMYMHDDKVADLTTRYQVIPLNGGTFDLDVNVLVTEDTAFALTYVKKHLDSTASSDDFNSRGTTFTSINGGSTIIWLPNTEDESIVMHELLHATIDIMRRVGISLTEETEEAYTYELQYLTNQFYKQNQTK